MRRHPLDLISLMFGLLFVGLGLTFGFADAITVLQARWLWPVVLILLGVALVVGPVTGNRSDDTPSGSEEPTTSREGHPPR